MGLSFTIAADPRQHSHFQVRVSRDWWPLLLSQSRGSPDLEGQVSVLISFRDKVARLYPQALGLLFVASYDSQGYGGELLVFVTQHRHGSHRNRLSHYCVFSDFRGNNVYTELFPSSGCCTVASLQSCYLAMDLHVRILTREYSCLRGTR
jgi:hypothetical protein